MTTQHSLINYASISALLLMNISCRTLRKREMGNEDHDQDYSRKQQAYQQQSQNLKLKLLLLVILTNLLTIYILTGPLSFHHYPFLSHSESNLVLHELNSSKAQLAASQSLIAELHQKLNSTNLLVQALLIELTRENDKPVKPSRDHAPVKLGNEDSDSLSIVTSDELILAVGTHNLPFGYSSRLGSDEIHMPVGTACLDFHEELNQYMSYDIGGECPVDDVFAQRLMLKGCEPLPRRRCHPKSPMNYVEPTPLPESLWTKPPETSIIWDPYACKSYQCLIDRKKKPGYLDCKDCFDLQGREKTRWLFDNGGLDFGIDQVLGTKPAGTIRIGFDIGGGTGTFAARMKERNVTIITSTLNLDGPFNNFIASRGLIPIHLSVSQRLPFFENTLDIVHSMHVLSNWIPDTMLEFALYDIYRVLRPGGLFWLDHFFCYGSQLNKTYVPMLDRVGFRKLRWHAGKKLDRGIKKNEWYFSALLEKPMT